jgi:hypothetical protein
MEVSHPVLHCMRLDNLSPSPTVGLAGTRWAAKFPIILDPKVPTDGPARIAPRWWVDVERLSIFTNLAAVKDILPPHP